MITKFEKKYLSSSDNVVFPSSWEDLDPLQFISTLCLLMEFKEKRYDVREFQLRLFIELSNIRSRSILKKDYQWFEKEIFRNLDKMNFCFRFVYDDPKFKNLDVKMQNKLKKINPENIPGEPEAVVARTFKRSVEIDASISRQMIPQVFLGLKKYEGYKFELIGDIVKTTITAEQYINALTFISLLAKDKSSEYIDLLVASLYCKNYSETTVLDNAGKFKMLNPIIKYAILFNFESILQWISNETKYSVLFRQGKKSEKISLGLNAVIFSMTEKGYGNPKEISAMNLIDFLELMYKNLVDSITQLSEAKMDKLEIAKKLNLTLEQINQFI